MKTKKVVSPEIAKIFYSQSHEIAARVDHFLSFLLIIQWVIAVSLSLRGTSGALWLTVLGGGLLSLLAVLGSSKWAGALIVRYWIGLSQMLFSVMFSFLTDGRVETQIHVFVSLAALAFYKDIPLLIVSSAIVMVDYVIRAFTGGAFELVWLEMLAWVIVEDVILLLGIYHTRAELWEMANSKYLLQASREEALRLSSTKTNYLSRMSHEIRTPLNSIIGFSDVLKDTNLEAEQADYVQTIHKCSESLLHIINDILDVSKIENGLLQIDAHTFDIRELHEDIHKMFINRCAEKGVSLELKLDPRAPRYVEGDSHRLRQVLINLVGNAVKFTDKGAVVIEVDSSIQESIFHWKVSDTGRGIREENIPKLFNNFYQEDPSVSRKFGGSGLGLVISKNLIELMGGEIQVTSQQGEGSTFRFSLPIRYSHNAASEASS